MRLDADERVLDKKILWESLISLLKKKGEKND